MKITSTPTVEKQLPKLGDLAPGDTFIPHGKSIFDASALRAVFMRGPVALVGNRIHVLALADGVRYEWSQDTIIQPVEATLNISLP